MFPRMRNVLDRVVEKIKTHIVRSIFFFFENYTAYEMMSKIVVEPDRPHDNMATHCTLD